MPAPRSRELLFRLLQGETLSPSEVSGLVKAFEATKELEGQWFDLKAGALLQNKEGDELRAAACGFANAEGGFLLIGYNETAKAFDHVAPVGKQAPEQWVANALGSLAHLIPPPRLVTVDVEGGPVLLVTFERAPALVYVIEKGEPVYYIRFGHQTLPMPPSHVADLLLGRRAQANLQLVNVTVQAVRVVRLFCERVEGLDIGLRVTYENEALILAEHVRVGLVGWAAVPPATLPRQLRRSIQFEQPPEDLNVGGPNSWRGWGLCHAVPPRGVAVPPAGALAVEPFAFSSDLLNTWRLPIFRRHPEADRRGEIQTAVETKAALYLLARNAEPQWWQLRLRYNEEAARQLAESAHAHLRFEPCFYFRPVVSLRFLDEGEPVEFTPECSDGVLPAGPAQGLA